MLSLEFCLNRILYRSLFIQSPEPELVTTIRARLEERERAKARRARKKSARKSVSEGVSFSAVAPQVVLSPLAVFFCLFLLLFDSEFPYYLSLHLGFSELVRKGHGFVIFAGYPMLLDKNCVKLKHFFFPTVISLFRNPRTL